MTFDAAVQTGADCAAALTVETTPACDVARLVVSECGAVLWQACDLDLVIDDSAVLQLKESNVIPTQQHIKLFLKSLSLFSCAEYLLFFFNFSMQVICLHFAKSYVCSAAFFH